MSVVDKHFSVLSIFRPLKGNFKQQNLGPKTLMYLATWVRTLTLPY